MSSCPGRLRIATLFLLLAGCAHPPPPVAVAAPAPAGPSPQALRNEWLKGYEAGLYDGKREQARRDRVLLVPSTLPPPPPPPPGTEAAALPAPAAVVPPVQAPPQSVFVPAGPAEPVTRNP